MSTKQWYEAMFKNYAHQYERESFVKGTLGECDFIERELGFNKTLKIIDVGCGTGRHAIELSKRGYSVTGIDLSENMLQKARDNARKEKLQINFVQHDARDLPFEREFDAAIMLCEGGFPLMETDEMNFAILQSVSGALKDSAKFIFTTLNGLFPIFHSIDAFHAEEGEQGVASYKSETFDLMTFRDHNLTTFTDDDGQEHAIECNERYYIPSEITWLLKTLGFKTIDIYGARLGAFSRNDRLGTGDFEMLVIAER